MLNILYIGTILTGAGYFYLVRDDEFVTQAFCVFAGLVVGAVIGYNVFEKIFEKPIIRNVCKVNDTRLLT